MYLDKFDVFIKTRVSMLEVPNKKDSLTCNWTNLMNY